MAGSGRHLPFFVDDEAETAIRMRPLRNMQIFVRNISVLYFLPNVSVRLHKDHFILRPFMINFACNDNCSDKRTKVFFRRQDSRLSADDLSKDSFGQPLFSRPKTADSGPQVSMQI